MFRSTCALISVFCFSIACINAQVPTVQDCLGAIQICDTVYYQPNSFTGTGNYPEEIPTTGGCPGNCMLSGELNDVWYRVSIQSDGYLGFEITPVNADDDYDWVVYNLTDAACEDIFSQAADLQVSCNYSLKSGATGPNGNSELICQVAGGWRFNDLIPVLEGETYVINISNYSSSQSGYTLDLSPSTAQIFDNTSPEIKTVYAGGLSCGANEIPIVFTEKVQCNTVQPSALQVVGPDSVHEVTNIYGEACSIGAPLESNFTLSISPPLSIEGMYYVEILPFTSIMDACDNIAQPQKKYFYAELNAPVIDENEMEINNSSCGQSNGSITGLVINGNEPLIYQWFNENDSLMGSEPDLAGVPAGIYTLVVTDQFGCKSISGPHTISDEGAPDIDLSMIEITNNYCDGQNGSISGITVDGSPPLLYIWTDQQNNTVSQELILENMPGGIYSLVVEDANGCSALAGPFTIEDFPGPLISDSLLNIEPDHCDMNTGSVTDIAVSSPFALQYRWFNQNNDTVGTTPDIFNLSAGTYSLLVKDDNGCTAITGPYMVPEAEGPLIDTTDINLNNATCGMSNGEISGLAVSANSSIMFEWFNQDGEAVGDTLNLTGIPPGEYLFSVTDSAGCVSEAGPFKIENAGGVALVDETHNDPRCGLSNGSIIIDASSQGDYLYYSIDGGLTWQDSALFDNLTADNYNLCVKDENNCIDYYIMNPVSLENEGEIVLAQARADSPVCEGEDIILETDNIDVIYQWSGPLNFFSNERNPVLSNVNANHAGSYTLIVSSVPYGCSDTTNINIRVLNRIEITPVLHTSKINIDPAEELMLNLSIPDTLKNPIIEWLFDGIVTETTEDTVLYINNILTDQTFQCRVYADNLCLWPYPMLSNTVSITVSAATLLMPNAFKPGSIYGNNEFKPVSLFNQLANYEMLIYDRWGKNIFHSNEIGNGWRGDIDGSPAPAGVYVWIVRYTISDEDDKPKNFMQKGTLMLLR